MPGAMETHSPIRQSSNHDMDDQALEELVERLAIQTNQDGETNSKHSSDSTPEGDSLSIWPSPPDAIIASHARSLRIPLTCRECRQPDKSSKFVLCGGCGRPHLPVHPSCLLKKQDHIPSTTTDDSYYAYIRCEEINFQDFVLTNKLMNTKMLEQNKSVLHLEDVSCTWIGVPDSLEGTHPQINVWPRLQRLLESSDSSCSRQYPSLVSFIGETGSGKSTLIRAIINLLRPSGQKLSTPLPGFTNDLFDSTSSDIHVYPDPHTLSTERPIFFVDCEGLAGAENPIARQMISSMRTGKPVEERLSTTNERSSSTERRLQDETKDYINNPTIKTDLLWGKTVQPTAAQTMLSKESKAHVDPETRKTVVEHLYPRLLYAFSDVVCFVSNNSRKSEEFISKLIDWAKDGHEKTINQQVKPALIIALNRDTEAGNTTVTMEQLTSRLLKSFQKKSKYKELVNEWETRGKKIENASELLLCYYDSFSVITIPACNPHSTPAVLASMASRIRGLYENIGTSANAIYEKRLPLNAEFDIATLNSYLEISLQILGKDHREDLDFHELSEGDLQMPKTFSEHMARSMFNLAKIRGLDSTSNVGGELTLVEDFTSYIASCIVAQLPVHLGDDTETPTSPSPSKHADGSEALETQKSELVNDARRGLRLFHDRYWRCEALNSTKTKRCANYFNGHDKGHQFGDSSAGEVSESSTGVLESGSHLCSWDPSAFNNQLLREMYQLRNREEATHRRSELAIGKGITKIQSQRTCLSCLANCPTNILPCRENQHGICDACIRVHCKYSEHDSVVNIKKCPLGCSLTIEPWAIRVKPETAGPRILALDGGGVRGLVELSLLEKIEQEVGFGITVHELFDMVIGTSTGGIVALGVFHQNWSPSHGISVFKSLVEEAFSFRQRLEVPWIRTVIQPFCSFKYTDEGIEEALKQAFGPEAYLFGPPLADSGQKPGDQVKVGVVACLEGRNQPCLIANYSRNPQREEDDYLCREENQQDDFKVWEAARATSAAPTYFKPFHHTGTNKDYKDGAVVRNNPIRVAVEEHQKIWRDAVQPDIIVSLGTGEVTKRTGHVKTTKRNRDKMKLLLPSGIRKKIETGLDMIESTLSCQREWDDFIRSISHNRQLAKNSHRINIPLPHRVQMDDYGSAGELLHQCRTYLDECSDLKAHIGVVARRLTAALFYLDSNIQGTLPGGVIHGVIRCRLTPHSAAATSLLAHEPEFRLREVLEGRQIRKTRVEFLNLQQPFNYRNLSASVVFNASQGYCKRVVEFKLKLRNADWEPISGF